MRNRFSRLSHNIRKTRWLRNTSGFALVVGGIFGPIMPVLGVWMLPLGLLLLSADFPWAHRWHVRISNWLHRHRHRRGKRVEQDSDVR